MEQNEKLFDSEDAACRIVDRRGICPSETVAIGQKLLGHALLRSLPQAALNAFSGADTLPLAPQEAKQVICLRAGGSQQVGVKVLLWKGCVWWGRGTPISAQVGFSLSISPSHQQIVLKNTLGTGPNPWVAANWSATLALSMSLSPTICGSPCLCICTCQINRCLRPGYQSSMALFPSTTSTHPLCLRPHCSAAQHSCCCATCPTHPRACLKARGARWFLHCR